MFDRFIRLQQARKALREGRFEDALQLASDPLIRTGRPAEDVIDRARASLLERGRARLAAGDLRSARAVQQRLAALAENEQVRELGRELDAGEEDARRGDDRARQGLEEAARLMRRGDVAAAAAAAATVPKGRLDPEYERLELQLADRRRQAGELLVEAAALLERDAVAEAQRTFVKAAALDRAAAEGAALRPRLCAAVARRTSAAIAERLAVEDLAGAFAELRATTGSALGDVRPLMADAIARLDAALLRGLRGVSDLAAGCRLAALADGAGAATHGSLGSLVEALSVVAGRAGEVDPGLLRQVQRAAHGVGARGLSVAARNRVVQLESVERRLAAARDSAASGDLDAARKELTEILAEDPMHEAARRELELLEQGMAELSGRLDAARAAARAGRLREACAAALALGSSGRIAADAQLLLTDVRARMALVERGLEEVLAALHGRAAGSIRGVRHCLGRLEELAKVQTDHADLPRVIAAVEAEVAGLEACDRCAEALSADRAGEAAAALDEIVGLRPRLLATERLDARLLALADQLAEVADRALAAGRGTDLEHCLGALERLKPVGDEFPRTAARLRGELAARVAEAEERVAEARRRLAERDLAEAEGLLEDAERLWADASAVRGLAEEVRALRRQASAVEEVAALARDRDYRAAADRLAEMPPTPPLLRTRIFDMKQELARAQGLEGAFLLRVDEGGEHLVLRRETVSIGNMRQRRADLPILANIAGRHATIRRSMSFHGGMEDAVVAEDGEVRVAGRVVDRHRLKPGDRIQLGTSLSAVYERPSSRSLSVGLVLQGGFQVAGTERLLLMKDRGKDGRILIGPSRDVHVRVAGATGEVELFAASNGQIRVACRGGGEIDGAAFRGEHPVDAGQMVSAEGITFVLLPWRPA